MRFYYNPPPPLSPALLSGHKFIGHQHAATSHCWHVPRHTRVTTRGIHLLDISTRLHPIVCTRHATLGSPRGAHAYWISVRCCIPLLARATPHLGHHVGHTFIGHQNAACIPLLACATSHLGHHVGHTFKRHQNAACIPLLACATSHWGHHVGHTFNGHQNAACIPLLACTTPHSGHHVGHSLDLL